MIFEGLKLMFVGMGIVFVFLILLMISIQVLGKLLVSQTQAELDASLKPSSAKQSNDLIAVISAAVQMYRKRH